MLSPTTEPYWIERYGRVGLTGEATSFEAMFGPLNIYYHVRAFQTRPGQFGVMFTDISERREIERQLRENEVRWKDVVFNTGDWVWEVDKNGVYTYSSQKGVDLLGRSPEEIIGKTPFDFMTPEDAKAVAASFSEIVARKASIIDLENWNVTKDGRRICLLTNGVPIRDFHGTASE
jgi:PAS domain S-box-containing protein